MWTIFISNKTAQRATQVARPSITVQGIRETRSKGLLVEIGCAAKDRDRLDSVFWDVVGEQGTVHHLVPIIQVKILDLDPTTEEAQAEVAVRSFLQEDPSVEAKVMLARSTFRGSGKAFVQLEEVHALGLLKRTYYCGQKLR